MKVFVGVLFFVFWIFLEVWWEVRGFFRFLYLRAEWSVYFFLMFRGFNFRSIVDFFILEGDGWLLVFFGVL